MDQSHRAIRELMAEACAVTSTFPNLLTSKSLRMCHATLADIRVAQWAERLAIGNWTEVAGADASAKEHTSFPIRYAGKKDASAEFARQHTIIMAARATAVASDASSRLRVALRSAPHAQRESTPG